jgi:hypothetical protein
MAAVGTSAGRRSLRAISPTRFSPRPAGPPKYRSIPKLALQAFGLFQPFMREVAEMYYLFDSDFVLDDSALRRGIGDFRKTPVQQGLQETAAWMPTH